MKKNLLILFSLILSSLAATKTYAAEQHSIIDAFSIPVECYHSTAAIAKINYHIIDSISKNHYYRWTDHSIPLSEDDLYGYGGVVDLNYLNKQDTLKYGIITSDMFYLTEADVPTTLLYNSYQHMIERTTEMENEKPESERFVDSYYYGYIIEELNIEGETISKPILYIIHYNSKMNDIEVNCNFHLSDNPNFSDDLDNDGYQDGLWMVTNNVKPLFGTVITHMGSCVNSTVILSCKFDKPQQEGPIFCLSDVVIGNYSDTELTNIRLALTRFREAYPELILQLETQNDIYEKEQPLIKNVSPKGSFTQEDADLLNQLIDGKLISFNKIFYEQFLPYNTKVNVTFFNISSEAYTVSYANGFEELIKTEVSCDNYIQHTLDGTKSPTGLLLGDRNVTLPLAMELEPYAKRMYKDDPINIPVKAFSDDNYSIMGAALVYSNDPDFEEDFDENNPLIGMLPTPLLPQFEAGEDLTPYILPDGCDNISFTPVLASGNFVEQDGSFKGFKDGYFYVFHLVTTNSNMPPEISAKKKYPSVQKSKKQLRSAPGNINPGSFDCDDGPYFILKIIPEYAVYNGGNNPEDKEEWNKDENWYVADRQGTKVSDPCYVPGDRTKVFIDSDRVVLPEAENIKSLIRFEDGFQANTCDTIHFHNAEMGYQHLLNYNAAIVDIDVKEKEWNLLGFPLKDMVSGDIFAEKTDAEDHFTVPEKGNAINVLVWQKLFNRNMQNMTLNGNVEVNSTAWNTPANTVKERYNPGTAVLIWPSNNSDMVFNEGEMTFHLPKRDTKYYYFNSNLVRTNINESVDLLAGETSRSSRLAYEVNANGEMEITLNATSPSTLFTFANPTLDLINLDEFFKANQGVIENKAYIIDGKEEAATVSPIAKIGLRFSANILSDQLKTNGYLSPTEAIMLHSKTKASSITVKVPVTALKAYMDRTSANTTPTKRMASAGGDATLYMKAECNDQVSYASVYVDGNADNDYVSKEDAEMIFIDDSTTPGAIYTVASGKALSINGLSAFSKIPMAVYTVDSNAKTAKVTFTGVDSFDGAISLFDITDGSVKTITEGDVLELATTNMNDNIRYYLQKTADIATDAELVTDNDAINVFVADGKIQVVANEDLKNVSVYNAAGQEIINNKANGRHASYTVSAGVYVVKAYTEDNQTTRKVVLN